MKLHILTSILISISSIVYGQDQVIRITDEFGNPLSAFIEYQKQYIECDRNGLATIEDIKLPANITYYADGYLSEYRTIKEYQSLLTITLSNKLEEITITESSHTHRLKSQIDIGMEEILESSSQNLSDLLQNKSGMYASKNGGNMANPILHGLSGKRLPIIINGIRNISQDWTHNHGGEVSHTNSEKISIIKGASSILYGSGSLGGVISIENTSLYDYQKNIEGIFKTSFSTNGYGTNTAVQLGGRIKKSAFTWKTSGNFQKKGNYRTPNEYLDNTGFVNSNYSLVFGYNKHKTKLEVSRNTTNNTFGVFTGSRIASQDDLKRLIDLQEPVTSNKFEYTINAPNQKVRHTTTQAQVKHLYNDHISFTVLVNNQVNHRKEYEPRRNGFTSTPTNNVKLSSNNVNLKTLFSYDNSTLTLGQQYAQINNQNISGTGVVPVMPNYVQESSAIFAVAEKHYGYFDIEGGFRYDIIKSNSKGLDLFGEHYGGKKQYKSHSFDFGVGFQKDRLSINYNISYGWRAPNPNELYARGLQHASSIYNRGNQNLTSEGGYKNIFSLEYNTDKISLTTSVYHHKIKNYIYTLYSGENVLKYAGIFPVYDTTQDDAILKGLDIALKIDNISRFTLEANFSTLNAYLQKDKSYLPQMPPNTLRTSVGYKLSDKKAIRKLSLTSTYNAKQNKYSFDKEFIPFAPESFYLLELNLGGKINHWNWNLTIDNLLNTSYSLYTDSFRYFSNQKGRDLHINLWLKF